MRIKEKLKNRSGFTLAETLLAVLILLLVSVIVANGIPVARDHRRKCRDATVHHSYRPQK